MWPATVVRYCLPDNVQWDMHSLGAISSFAVALFEALLEYHSLGLGYPDDPGAQEGLW